MTAWTREELDRAIEAGLLAKGIELIEGELIYNGRPLVAWLLDVVIMLLSRGAGGPVVHRSLESTDGDVDDLRAEINRVARRLTVPAGDLDELRTELSRLARRLTVLEALSHSQASHRLPALGGSEPDAQDVPRRREPAADS